MAALSGKDILSYFENQRIDLIQTVAQHPVERIHPAAHLSGRPPGAVLYTLMEPDIRFPELTGDRKELLFGGRAGEFAGRFRRVRLVKDFEGGPVEGAQHAAVLCFAQRDFLCTFHLFDLGKIKNLALGALRSKRETPGAFADPLHSKVE